MKCRNQLSLEKSISLTTIGKVQMGGHRKNGKVRERLNRGPQPITGQARTSGTNRAKLCPGNSRRNRGPKENRDDAKILRKRRNKQFIYKGRGRRKSRKLLPSMLRHRGT